LILEGIKYCFIKGFDFAFEVAFELTMADDFVPLYRRALLRLAADATGAGRLARPDATASVHNPACGDRVTVDLVLGEGRVIIALAHETHACLLTQASAALLALKALSLGPAELSDLAQRVRAFLKGGPAPQGYAAFDGFAGHAGRHVCVMLPLEAALKALENAPQP
jgi:nitrogen fixation NifU-like protein